jgi:hypothetical protein
VRQQPGFVNVVGHDARNVAVMLAWAEDGNLLASSDGSLFATLNGAVIGDTNGRLLHYYEPPMAASGISRLRLASVDKTPIGSVLV